ncbi:MAG: hypothetical protein V7647_3175, partial [Acidobacteriota bacterium]
MIGPAIACAALAATRRPSILRPSPSPALDLCVLAVLAATLLQLVPLPRPLLSVLSPAAPAVEAAFALVPPGGLRPMTINPHDSLGAAAVLAGVILLFVTARRTFDDGGIRTLIRIVALVGLALSGIALAQDATAKGLMYWRFAPDREGPYPFGPFINRNHFATWAMMAVPLCAGYLAAHAAAHPHAEGVSWRRRLLLALDGRTWMLAASAMLLMIATAASLSRSGLAGLAASMVSIVVLVGRPTA